MLSSERNYEDLRVNILYNKKHNKDYQDYQDKVLFDIQNLVNQKVSDEKRIYLLENKKIYA